MQISKCHPVPKEYWPETAEAVSSSPAPPGGAQTPEAGACLLRSGCLQKVGASRCTQLHSCPNTSGAPKSLGHGCPSGLLLTKQKVRVEVCVPVREGDPHNSGPGVCHCFIVTWLFLHHEGPSEDTKYLTRGR